MAPGRALTLSLLLHAVLLTLPLAPVPAAQLARPATVLPPMLQVGWQAVPASGNPVAASDAGNPLSKRIQDNDAAPAPTLTSPVVHTRLAPHYYRSDEVDQRAEPIETPPIVIPEFAYVTGMRGKIRARLFVSPQGTVTDVEILSASPPGVYERAALDALNVMRFTPARLAGRPVGNVKELTIELDPYETISQP